MLRFLKRVAWVAGIVLGCQSAFGFALIGPVPASGTPDDYQVPAIAYALGTFGITASNTLSTYPLDDPGTPKNIAEGYRRNTPVIYYSFDASFLKFFGPQGATAVDQAMAVYNNVGKVSAYSPDLSEFPTDTRRKNYRAAADSLLDVKSITMGLMTEQLGFWQPVRWVWALHDRANVPPIPCPGNMEYTVIKRNFDIVPSPLDGYQSSSYVNGVLYSYEIVEGCTTIPAADAVEFPVDPLASAFSAVADYQSFWYQGLTFGTFYNGLTRDDVGGLRYLIGTNNYASETAGGRTIEFVTNSQPAIITNQDLGLFSARAATNDPATLVGLYPGLIITSTNMTFGLGVTTNITGLATTNPYSPAGVPVITTTFTTNFTTNVITFFQYTFGNVVTNQFATLGLVGTETLGLTNSPYSPAITPFTVVTNTKFSYVHGVFGSFFLLPTNLCGVQILSNLLTTVIATTNPPVGSPIATNLPAGTAATNAVVFVPGSITFFTNQVTIYLPVTCPVDTVADRQGMDQVTFVRRDYDSLLNQFWDPVTNDYTLVELTNYTLVPRHMQRAVPRPDILFSVADLALNSAFTYSNTVAGTTVALSVTITGFAPVEAFRSLDFDLSTRPGNTAGPGTIISPPVLPTLIVFNKTGPLYFNNNILPLPPNATFLGEGTQTNLWEISWASFDATTNAPTVYPNGTSIVDLENLLTGPATTTSTLPAASVGVAYSAQLAGTGGQPFPPPAAPYAWSLSPNSLGGLPPGFSLSSDGQITAASPGGPGGGQIYDFTIRITDSKGAFSDQPFTITVF